jgi:hypothetical protein
MQRGKRAEIRRSRGRTGRTGREPIEMTSTYDIEDEGQLKIRGEGREEKLSRAATTSTYENWRGQTVKSRGHIAKG